jgi:DNA-binding ferritin-like protein
MKAADLMALLFLSRDVAHRVHLATRSYSKHKALDKFYHDIVEAADTFAETYQGCYGLLGTIPVRGSKASPNITAFLEAQVKEIKEGRDAISDDSEIQNQIDEILAVFHRTIYKLKFLA